MAHTLYGSEIPSFAASPGRMRDNDVLFKSGTQPGTPLTSSRRVDTSHRFSAPTHAAADADPATASQWTTSAAALDNFPAKYVSAPAKSDTAALQSQLRLCEHEIYTLRERLRLANDNLAQKDAQIASLNSRLTGVPNSTQREWCGGPCMGTKPLTGKGGETASKRRQRKKVSRHEGDVVQKEDLDPPPETARSNRSQGSQNSAASGMEHQLDREIAICQGLEADSPAEDPDLAAWKNTNSIGRDPTSRFVVPSASLDIGDDTEDGLMGMLDREIKAALQLEEAEVNQASKNMDLIQALDMESGDDDSR